MDGTITIGAKIETKQFDKQIEDMERKIADLENQLKLKGTGVLDERQIHDVEVELEKSKNQLAGLYQQKARLDASGNGKGFGNLADGLRDAVKHAGRLVLSVFGIRSAYLALRRASSDLASYDAQYGANLEYIRYALTQMIAPALVWIVNLAKTVLSYINYIANALFGVNLFSRASADNFKKMKSGIGGANSEAKKLQKTLTGFDEMNILNSSSTGGGGGVGGAGGIGPDFNLADLGEVKGIEWLDNLIQDIKKNKDIIILALKEIAGIIGVIASLKILGIFKGISDAFLVLSTGATMLAKVLAGVGLALIFTGIAIAIKGVIDFIDNPSWENARKVFLGLSVAVTGLGVAMVALNASNPLGWITMAIGAVASLGALVKQLTTEENFELTTEQQLATATDQLREKREKLKQTTDKFVNAVDRAEEAERALRQAEIDAGMTADELLKKMRDQNLTYMDLNTTERELYKRYLDNTNAQETLAETTRQLTTDTKSANESFYIQVTALKQTSKSADEYRDKVIKMYQQGKLSAEETTRAISIALADMDKDARRTFVENVPSEIKSSLDPSRYNTEANALKDWWNNSLVGNLNTNINLKFGFTNLSVVQNTIKKLKDSVGFRTGGLVKLASGGVVNMPNRGVPLASAIAGESGREGIIPLTDSGAMQELGKEIGKWITINANITNNMNGRVISRELRSIQNDQNFAYNA